MRICISGPESLSDFHCDYFLHQFINEITQQMHIFVDTLFNPSYGQSFYIGYYNIGWSE